MSSFSEFKHPSRSNIEPNHSENVRQHVAELLKLPPFQAHDYIHAVQGCLLTAAARQSGDAPNRSRALLDKLCELRRAHANTEAPATIVGAVGSSSSPRSRSSASMSRIVLNMDEDEEDDESERLLGSELSDTFLPAIESVVASSADAPHCFSILIEGSADEPRTVYVCFDSLLKRLPDSKGDELCPENLPAVAIPPITLGDGVDDRAPASSSTSTSGTSTPNRVSSDGIDSDGIGSPEKAGVGSAALLNNTLVLARYLGPACNVPLEPFVHYLKRSALKQQTPAAEVAAEEAEMARERGEKQRQVDARQQALAQQIGNQQLASHYAPDSAPAMSSDKQPFDSPPHRRSVSSAAQQCPGARLIICGHGHGAAVAQLVVCRLIARATADGADWLDRIGCLVFDAPAVGCARFYKSKLSLMLSRRCLNFTSAKDTLVHMLHFVDSSVHFIHQNKLRDAARTIISGSGSGNHSIVPDGSMDVQKSDIYHTRTSAQNKAAEKALKEAARLLHEAMNAAAAIPNYNVTDDQRREQEKHVKELKQWQSNKKKGGALLRSLEEARLALYGEVCATLSNDQFYRVGTKFLFLYAGNGRHCWINTESPHFYDDHLHKCAIVNRAEMQVLKHYALSERLVSINPVKDWSAVPAGATPTVAQFMEIANLQDVDSSKCLQWSSFNETDKQVQNQVQVQISGSNLGWVAHVTVKGGEQIPIQPSIGSNQYRLLFHFPCNVVLKEATDELSATILLHSHLAVGAGDHSGVIAYPLQLRGPMDDLLAAHTFSSIVNMDLFTLVKRSFISWLISPVKESCKFDAHFGKEALGRFFAGRDDRKVVDKKVDDWVRMACSSAPMMQRLSLTYSLSALQGEVDHANLDDEFKAERRRREADVEHITKEEKARATEEAERMVHRFKSFEGAKEEYFRYRPQRLAPDDPHVKEEWGISRYCEVIFLAAILVDLSVSRFKLSPASLLVRYLTTAAIVIGVALVVAGVAAAGVFTFGVVPAAVGGGLAGLVALSVGSGVSLLKLMAEQEVSYLDKLTVLSEVLGVDPSQLPACPFLLEEKLFGVINAKRHNMSAESVQSGLTLESLRQLTSVADSMKKLFGHRITSPSERDRVAMFLLDVWSLHQLRLLLLDSMMVGVCGPQKQGKSTLLKRLNFDARYSENIHTSDVAGYQWEGVEQLHFLDFPGWNDMRPLCAAVFDRFVHLSSAYIVVSTYQDLDIGVNIDTSNSKSKRHLRMVVDSGKPFLLCVNKGDEYIAKEHRIQDGEVDFLDSNYQSGAVYELEYKTRDELITGVRGDSHISGKLDQFTEQERNEKFIFPHEARAKGKLPSIVFTAFNPHKMPTAEAVRAMRQADFYSIKEIVGWVNSVAAEQQASKNVQDSLARLLSEWQRGARPQQARTAADGSDVK